MSDLHGTFKPLWYRANSYLLFSFTSKVFNIIMSGLLAKSYGSKTLGAGEIAEQSFMGQKGVKDRGEVND